MESSHGVKAGAAISDQEAIEFRDFLQSLDLGFALKPPERQVMVKWYTIHMCGFVPDPPQTHPRYTCNPPQTHAISIDVR